MRAFERSGVVIDQCTQCRGIYLDRGELERLIDAESAAFDTYGARPPDSRGHGGHGSDHDRSGRDQYGRQRKRGGFLSDLFD